MAEERDGGQEVRATDPVVGRAAQGLLDDRRPFGRIEDHQRAGEPGADAGAQHRRAERLGQIVGRRRFTPIHRVGRDRAVGEHDDRQVPPAEPLAQRRQPRVAVEGLAVDDRDVRQELGAARERRVDVGLAQELEPVLAEDLLDLVLVRADHQHAAAGDLPVLQRGRLGHVERDAAAALHAQLEPFPGREHVQRLAATGDLGARRDLHLLEDRVVVGRVVMEQHQTLHPRGQGHVDGVLDTAVPPADLVEILLGGVLRVVDDEVRALQERDVALVTRMLGDPARRAPERLVVGDVGDARAVAGHAVGDGGRGVIQVLRLDQHLAHAKESLVELVEVDARAQVAQLHREVRVLHLARHRLLEPALEAHRRVDVQLGSGQERRDEEGEALDVIPVRVADEEVEAHRLRDRLRQVHAELAGAGAAVEDDHGSVGGAPLPARGITPVPRGVRARRGDRPTSPPDASEHGDLHLS